MDVILLVKSRYDPRPFRQRKKSTACNNTKHRFTSSLQTWFRSRSWNLSFSFYKTQQVVVPTPKRIKKPKFLLLSFLSAVNIHVAGLRSWPNKKYPCSRKSFLSIKITRGNRTILRQLPFMPKWWYHLPTCYIPFPDQRNLKTPTNLRNTFNQTIHGTFNTAPPVLNFGAYSQIELYTTVLTA